MKTPFILLVAVLVIVSFIIGGCASQPAPTTSAAPATTSAAPATTVAPKTTAPAISSAPTATSAPSQVIELRFSHHVATQAWTAAQFLNPWAKKVETATNGAVKITMYPSQSIATMQDNYDAVVNGLAHLTWIPTSPYQGRFPLSEVITQPFLTLPSGTIDGKKVGPAVVNSQIIQELYESIPEIQKEWAQTKLLFVHATDPYFLIAKKPVKTLADVKGLKIAVLGAGSAIEMWKRMGASPVYMTGPAIYEAGQKGVIDACAANWANIGSFRYNEIFPYALDMTSFATLFAVPLNLDAWNKMSPEVQKQVMSVSGTTGAKFAGDTAFGEGARNEVLAQINKSGSSLTINPIDSGELDKMKAVAGKPIWDEWVAGLKAKGQPSDKVMDAILKLLEKYK
jgi:TRAP-type C4-dicarboxylate transport system substrate-binding protein